MRTWTPDAPPGRSTPSADRVLLSPGRSPGRSPFSSPLALLGVSLAKLRDPSRIELERLDLAALPMWVQRMFLRNLRSARHASVRECSGVTDERVLALCTAAPQLQTLHVVGGPAVYGQLSAPLPELSVLELIRCGVEDTAALSRACPRLTTLRLDHCPLSTCQLELALSR